MRDYEMTILRVPALEIPFLTDARVKRTDTIQAFLEIQPDDCIKTGDPFLVFYAGRGGESDARSAGWPSGSVWPAQMVAPFR